MSAPDVRLRRELLPRRLTRAGLVARVASADGLAALLGGGATEDGRFDVVGIRPAEEWIVPAGSKGDPPEEGVFARSPFATPAARAAANADVFDRLRDFATRYALRERAADLPFACGVIAVLGFDLRTHVERLPDRHAPDPRCPELLARFFSAALVRDGRDDGVHLLRLEVGGDAAFNAAAEDVARELAARVAGPAPSIEAPVPARVLAESSDDAATFRAKVARVVERVRAGDVYQLNLARLLSGPCEMEGPALSLRLLESNPSPFGGLVKLGAGSWLCSASPERLLRIDGRRASTRPIKGTAPRGASPAEDAAFRAALVASEKERAELAMIVDLLRNDFSLSCRPGTVRVRDPWTPETHPTVHHLVATVEGELAEGRDLFDLLRGAWPGGSISGCPKRRALELIDGLEEFRRGPYTGSLAAFSADGRADLNVLIRSARVEDGRAWLGAGGGITIGSDPDSERAETLHKIRGLAAALNWELPE